MSNRQPVLGAGVVLTPVTGLSPRLRNDRGATAIEYALLLALVSFVIVVSVTFLGGKLSGVFGSVFSGSVHAPTGYAMTVACHGESGTGTATMTWNAVPGATGYKVITSTSPDMSNPVTTTVTATTAQLEVGSVRHQATYAEVEAVNGATAGAPTAVLNAACGSKDE
jgi:pilus assembly protein Flp/PilA